MSGKLLACSVDPWGELCGDLLGKGAFLYGRES